MLGLLAVPVGSAELSAQDSRNHMYDRFQFTASGTLVIFSSTIRVDSKSGDMGTEIDGSENLGLSPTKLQPRGAIRWRPGRRHEIETGYQFARRTGEKVLLTSIDFEDETFDVGARVRSAFKSDNVFLTYRFAFMARENTQIGFGLGVGALFFNAQLEALGAVVGGGGTQTVDFEASESLIGPTASVGFFGRFRLGERWYLEPDIRGIGLSIDRFDARIVEAGLAARHFLTAGVGLVGAWSGQSIPILVDPSGDGGVGGDVGGRLEYFTQNVRLGVVLVP
ncbi:MAG: hypothetical protein ACC682_05955 [Gemmatimonadota bacterium]